MIYYKYIAKHVGCDNSVFYLGVFALEAPIKAGVSPPPCTAKLVPLT